MNDAFVDGIVKEEKKGRGGEPGWEVYMALDPSKGNKATLNRSGNLRLRYLEKTNVPVLEVRRGLFRNGTSSLSSQEKVVGKLLMQGLSNREIAEAMGCSQTTISTFIKRMCKKTTSRSTRELIVFLVQQQAKGFAEK